MTKRVCLPVAESYALSGLIEETYAEKVLCRGSSCRHALQSLEDVPLCNTAACCVNVVLWLSPAALCRPTELH